MLMFGQLRKTTTKSNELGWRTLKWITLKLSAHLNCEKKEVNQRYPTWHEILENENVVVEQNLLDRFSSNDRNGFFRTFFIELSTKCNFRSRHLLPVAPVYSGSGSRHRKDLGVSISRARWPIFINSFTFNFVHLCCIILLIILDCLIWFTEFKFFFNSFSQMISKIFTSFLKKI